MDQPIRASGIVVVALLVLAGCRSADPAKIAGEFTVETVSAPLKKVSLKSLRGKVVLIDFWATWCPPCRESMPQVDKLYAKYRDQGVEFLAISNEKLSDLRTFQPKSGVSYPLYCDTDDQAMSAFKVESIPRLVIVNKQGEIVFDEEGAPLDIERIEQVLDRHR